MNTPPTVAIVDAYSTAALLPAEFRRRGWRCVHVRGTPRIPEIFRPHYRPDDFAAEIVHDGDIEATAAELARWSPRAVLSGAETSNGVELTDALGSRLGCPSNDPSLSRARRDKFEMIETVRAHGLKTARQFKAGSLEAALAWAEALGDWPVVVKPVRSVGTDSVFFCHTPGEVQAAFEAIFGRPNRIDVMNDAVLLQSLLRGTQYFVNTVSHQGRHYVTEVWGESKPLVDKAAFINGLEYLLPYRGEIQDALVAYTRGVLDALGVREGPSHTELMLTGEGPVLVETASRMQGSVDHEAVVRALGHSQVTATVDCVLDPQAMVRSLEDGYRVHRWIYCVALVSEQDGIIRDRPGLALLEGLPSFVSMIRIPPVGARLRRTVDLFSGPGIVYLVHEDAKTLRRDYEQIRQWERDKALFHVVPAG
jgi:biotin carboxylase